MNRNLTGYAPNTSTRTMKTRTKVLVISDDDEFIDEIIQSFAICLPKAELVFCNSGNEGVSATKTESSELIILDMSISDISAWDVLVKIRQGSQIPVMFISYSNNEADVVKSLELGCDGYVHKPIRQLEFMAYVRSIIKRRSLIQRKPV